MTADIVAAALAGLGPMIQQGSRKPVNRFEARRKFGDALMVQGANAAPVQGGIVEGLARAATGALGGWMAGRAERDELADEEKKSRGLIEAISRSQTPILDKDGRPTGASTFDFSPVAQALAANGQGAPAAYMMLMDQLARRQQGQVSDRAQDITGVRPGGAPAGGAGVDPQSYYGRVSSTESPNGATNPQSGAIGFFQFMPRTAIALAKQTQWGAGMQPEQIVAALRSDPAKQRDLMVLYTQQSEAALTQAGIPVNDMTRFALHAFGPAGGVSLLRAPDNMPVGDWVRSVNWGEATPEQVVQQNGLAKYQTVGQLRQDFIARRIGGGQAPQGAPQAPPVAGAPPQGMQPPQPQMPAGGPAQAAGVDDSGEDRLTRAGLTVPMPTGVTVDDGRADMERASRLFARNTPESIAEGVKFFQQAQAKALAAQQRAYDRQFKPAERVTGPDGIVRPVTGGAADPATIEREKAAAARGGGQYGDPELVGGAPVVRNTVTGKPDTLPAGDKIRAFDQSAVDVLKSAHRFLEVFKGAGNVDQINAFLENPRSPKARELITAYNNMITSLRGEAFVNTGVLQPAELTKLTKDFVDPRSLRGLLSTNGAMESQVKELERYILDRRETAYKSAGLEPPPLAASVTVPMPGTPPQNHVDALKADPALAKDFDAKYGPGASQRYLGGR